MWILMTLKPAHRKRPTQQASHPFPRGLGQFSFQACLKTYSVVPASPCDISPTQLAHMLSLAKLPKSFWSILSLCKLLHLPPLH